MGAYATKSKAEHGPALFTGIDLSVSAGYALFIAWFDGTKSFALTDVVHDPSSVVTLWAMCADLVGLVLIAALCRRIGSLVTRPALTGCAGVAALAALPVFLHLSLASSPQLPYPVSALGGLLEGGARAVLALVWMEMLSRLGMRRACASFAVATIAGTALGWLVGLLDPAAQTALAAVFGVASSGLAVMMGVRMRAHARAHGTDVRENPAKEKEDGQEDLPEGERIEGRWSFPFRPTLLMTAFATATLLVPILTLSPRPDELASGLENALVALALLVMTLLGTDRRGPLALGAFATPLACIGLLGASSALAFLHVPASFFASAGYQCFAVYTYILLFDISYRYGANPLWLFGFSRVPRVAVAIVLPLLAGAGVLPPAGSDPANVVLAAALVALVFLAALLPLSPSADGTWGIRQQKSPRGGGAAGDEGSEAQGAQPLDADELVTACYRASYRYGLTKREEEVLMLLVRGYTTPMVEQELVISNGTARNHVQHIYKKLGVHSREELRESVVGTR